MLLQTQDLASLFVDFVWVVDLLGDIFQLFVTVLFQCPVKAGIVADVALACIDAYFEDNTVLVAIHQYLFYFLKMPALFAFLPQFLP